MPTILGANTLSTGYEVENSLRFDDGSSAFLSKTFSGDGTSHDIGTVSFWIKRCELSAEQGIFTAGSSNRHFIRFESNNTFTFRAVTDSFHLNTNQIFRETSGWYHFVIAYDTTQGTASNRVKIYVNGVQLTSFATADYPDQNLDIKLGAAEANHIGNDAEQTNPYYDGYMAEFVYIDGQQLAPTSFGEFDEDSPNIWKPIDVSGLTFGTNGFYLEFKQTGTSANSSGMGADTSGNDNHFGTSGLAATDQSTDTCTNNFVILNTLDPTADITLSEGNLKAVYGTSGTRDVQGSTIGLSSGKWYWEVKIGGTSSPNNAIVGVTQLSTDNNTVLGTADNSWGYRGYDGKVFHNNSSAMDLGTFGDTDIIGVHMDLDNHKLYFAKNGSLQNSTGISLDTGKDYFPAISDAGSSATPQFEMNFGAGTSFTISSGNTDGTFGNFEYSTTITGDGASKTFKAINTKNIANFG